MMIIEGAESFLLHCPNAPRGVLLIHGFTGNPAELRLLGEYLQAAGLTVLCMRLAGHGTTSDDLVRSKRTDWFNSVLDGVSILKGLCKSISIVGHSMGGLLALKASTTVEIARLVSMDENMRVNELPPRSACQGLAVQRPRRTLKNVPRGVNDVYQSMPLSSVHELVDTIEETKKILPTVETPILILHGTADHTARFESAQYIFDRVSSTVKELELFEGMGHLLPLKEGRKKVFKRISQFLLIG